MLKMASEEDNTVWVVYIEGLATIGKVKQYWISECRSSKRKRVIVETDDGRVYKTRCLDERGVKKIVQYLAIALKTADILVEGRARPSEEIYVDESSVSEGIKT